MTEIIFVLKAISTLMDSLKKTQPENGEYQTVSRTVDAGGGRERNKYNLFISDKCVRVQLGLFFSTLGSLFPARSITFLH